MNILILDMHNICYGSQYGLLPMPVEPFGEVNAIFGGLRTIKNIAKNINLKWDYVYACFDTNVSHRKALSSVYKSNRKGDEVFAKQMGYLQKIMGSLGFTTAVFPGFEADDTIAKICRDNPADMKVVVSNDKDLYQLLDAPNVWLYRKVKNGYKYTAYSDFKKQYEIEPKDWIRVKAIAGCESDVVVGVEDIGEKRALDYIKGTLRKRYKDLIEQELPRIDENLKLVTLPFPELVMPAIPKEPFKFNPEAFDKLIQHFNFNSFSTFEWRLVWMRSI